MRVEFTDQPFSRQITRGSPLLVEQKRRVGLHPVKTWVAIAWHLLCAAVGGLIGGVIYPNSAEGPIDTSALWIVGVMSSLSLEILGSIPLWFFLLWNKQVTVAEVGQAQANEIGRLEEGNIRLKEECEGKDDKIGQLQEENRQYLLQLKLAGDKIKDLNRQLVEKERTIKKLERKLGLAQDCDPAIVDAYLEQIPEEVHGVKDQLRRCVGEIFKGRLVSSPDNGGASIDRFLVPNCPPEKQNLLSYGVERLSRVGEGGMGEVWTANCLSRVMAVKTILPKVLMQRGYETVLHFQREIELQQRFRERPHPNVVPVYHHQLDREPHFLIAPYVKNGLTLRQFINRVGGVSPQIRRVQPNGVLTEKEALTILYFVVLALEAAQKVHIIHRDIKPENIMLTQDEAFLRVLDFGSAKDPACGIVRKEELRGMLPLREDLFKQLLQALFVNPEQDELVIRQEAGDVTIAYREARIAEKIGELRMLNPQQQRMLIEHLRDKLREKITYLVGGTMSITPDYAGPERSCPQELEGCRLEHLIDIYALGMLFHEMRTGKTPREFKEKGTWDAFAGGKEPPLTAEHLEWHSPSVQKFVLRLVDRDWRNRRFQTYADIKQHLERLIRDPSII